MDGVRIIGNYKHDMLQKVPGMFEILISIYYWIFFYYKTFQNDVNIGESKNVNKMSDAKRLKLPVLNVRKKSKQILSNNLKLKRFSKKTQWVVYIQDFVFLFLFSFFIFLISFFPLSFVSLFLFQCFFTDYKCDVSNHIDQDFCPELFRKNLLKSLH